MGYDCVIIPGAQDAVIANTPKPQQWCGGLGFALADSSAIATTICSKFKYVLFIMVALNVCFVTILVRRIMCSGLF